MPPPDTLNLLGTTIADKYAVESVVGEGGFAIVYKATHLLWKRPVAVKVFKALGDVSPEHRGKLLEEFIREGALLADLSERSAAIVQARDVGSLKTARGDEVPYMVLEWLEGATLESVILDEKAKNLPPRTIAEAVRLLDPAAEALALAHAKGIAHRDVKPANVFVLGDPRSPAVTVKLLDFGIAKVVQDAQKMAGSFAKTSGQITSFTPAYGAPEQFSRAHGATGPWTDAFALALVVVEVLTQRDPLDGDDFMQLAYASSNPAARPTPRARGALVSDAVEQVFAQALAVRVQDRFQSAGDFWNALRAAVDMPPLRRATTNPISAHQDRHGPLSSQPTVLADSLREGAAVAAAPASGSAGAAPKKGNALIVGVGALVLVAGAFGVFTLRQNDAGSAAAPPSSSSVPSSAAAAPAAHAASDGASCPEGMIPVPGGEFFMGSDDGPEFERPAHHVRLAPFCIDRTEVTVAKYKACSDRGACKRAGTVNDWDGIKEHEKKAFDPLCNVREPVKLANHPINCVDWEMADQYCASQGAGMRLPTEAEWEFAARGPDGRQYPWGDDAPSPAHLNACGTECVAWGKAHQIDEKAMYPADDGFPNTSPVGSFPGGKSRYGVEDVAGNVWEWVGDWYAPYSAGAAGKNAAEMPENPKGPATGTDRVIRGGAWNGVEPSWVRPTFRFRDAPTKRSYGIGFRCAKSR